MTEDKWIEKYEPIMNPASDTDLYETNDPILSVVKSNHIWTLLEEGSSTWISPGYHFVNRLGYYITRKPWDINTEDIDLESNNEVEFEDDHCDDGQR